MELFNIPVFNLLFFVIFILVFFVALLDNVRVRVKNAKLNKEIEKSIIEYFILAQKYEDSIKNNDTKSIEQTEGFLKFVSESRDWAFQYIEEVQRSIAGLKNESAKVSIVPKSYLLSEELEELRKAIAEVLTHLPKESKND